MEEDWERSVSRPRSHLMTKEEDPRFSVFTKRTLGILVFVFTFEFVVSINLLSIVNITPVGLSNFILLQSKYNFTFFFFLVNFKSKNLGTRKERPLDPQVSRENFSVSESRPYGMR